MATYTQAKPDGTPTWTDHVSSDVEAARKFYHAVFGWEYDIGGPEFGGYTTARLGKRTTVGLTGFPPGAPPAPPMWSLYFASHNLEADVARAVKLGAKVLNPVMMFGDFGSSATLLDPTGAVFSFWKAGQHIGANVTDEPGSMSWLELYSPNAKLSNEFYSALLHATSQEMPGGIEYYFLKHGEKSLCGIMQIDPSWGNMQPAWVNYFAVANADETAAIIKKNGGKIMGEVSDTPFGRMAAALDPMGATFKIFQPQTG